jgi:alpha-beta hydrolase superfamily lysophospholipase
LVLLHGINVSWRVWKPVLPLLEREHDVLALTLPGHRGGPALAQTRLISVEALADGVEKALDAAGIGVAHLAGNSLGGWLALELARRGRALSVVALSPAGCWQNARDLRRVTRILSMGRVLIERSNALGFDPLLSRPRSRRMMLRLAMERGDRVAPREAAALVDDARCCALFPGFISWIRTVSPIRDDGRGADYPIRIAWSQHDRTIPYARYGQPFLTAVPGAEHVMLAGVGHVPMFDDPGLVARTVLEVTRKTDDRSRQMSDATDTVLNGVRGKVVVRRWDASVPRRVVVIAHGFGEHSGRYEHVARRLADDGAVVYAPDHHGHGRSDGEPGLVSSVEPLVDDLAKVIELARSENPDLPASLIGHSLGGTIATRYVQRGGHGLSGLVLSGPFIGGNPAIEGLLAMDPIPDVPIDPAVLSRDPAVGEAYAEDPLVYHGPLTRPTLEGIFAAVDTIAASDGIGDLPLLWIHGSDDELAPLDVTRQAVDHLAAEQIEVLIYPGARHEVFNETNRDEVLDELAGFLDGIQPRALA